MSMTVSRSICFFVHTLLLAGYRRREADMLETSRSLIPFPPPPPLCIYLYWSEIFNFEMHI